MRRSHILMILLLVLLALPTSPVQAGGIVTVCDEAHLRAALAGGGTVTFACDGVIILASELVIAADTTIDGSGQAVTLSGGNAVRVLAVVPGSTLHLKQLTIADGSADRGGGVFIRQCYEGCGDSALTIEDSTFTGNSATFGGGGVYISPYCFDNCGHLRVTIDNSNFTANTGGLGGAIRSEGESDSRIVALVVNDSAFSNNSDGILVGDRTTLAVRNSLFSGNDGDGIVTGLYALTNITVGHSVFSGNAGDGIRAVEWSDLSVGHSTFSGNDGCGIENWGGSLTVDNSTFTGNSQCGISSGDDGGDAIVTRSTFLNNGGIGEIVNRSQGRFALGNSTLVNNSGGRISNGWEGDLSVSNSTLDGISLVNFEPLSGSTLILRNTIVANGPAGSSCTGGVTDGGGNLSYPDATCPGIHADPLLGPLQDNGGATLTMAPALGSPAVDAGINAACATAPVNGADQRGISRPVGGRCDIGAVEVNYLPWRRWFPVMLQQ